MTLVPDVLWFGTTLNEFKKNGFVQVLVEVVARRNEKSPENSSESPTIWRVDLLVRASVGWLRAHFSRFFVFPEKKRKCRTETNIRPPGAAALYRPLSRKRKEGKIVKEENVDVYKLVDVSGDLNNFLHLYPLRLCVWEEFLGFWKVISGPHAKVFWNSRQIFLEQVSVNVSALGWGFCRASAPSWGENEIITWLSLGIFKLN